jgi:hypothetical protein
MADTYGAAGGTHAEEAYGDDGPPVWTDPTPTGELSVWPPADRQLALEAAARVMAGRSAGGLPALADGSSTVEMAQRFEHYLTAGT